MGKATSDPEYLLQVCVADMLRNFAREDVIWFHPPNGGRRSKAEGGRFKAMGVRPGVPDLVIVLPAGRVRFLELKAPKKYQSAAQREFEDCCVANGAPYAVAKTPEEASRVLFEWGALTKPVLDVAERRRTAE